MKTYFNKRRISRRDLKEYKLIGDGKDGEVYQLTHDKCVKMFFLEETQKKELKALVIGQSSPIIPRLYEYGENYIVMEYIHGISLARHLKKEKQITEELTEKILIMLDELKKIGFTRWDTEVRHVLINEEGQLKVIDHKRAFTSNSKAPIKLLKGLKKFGLSQDFLNNVKNIPSSVDNTWVKH
ncbi:AarF/UbiB family protein [Bacillus pseudomycoides]|uniref:AarF/UbiB family protein n=1 Tax=Bacillus pseudomycoides TaxID=64104 RepID=UPI000BEDAFFE|nr:AarF/UbiB family protein [Bacillus pseudomycoides]PED05196.1 kinase [Bacillus pseudomycoides]PEI99700.1 kinase [Bacillus pseudomycoides]PEK23599.1 kinase [Bacillus pseudomycoides]PEM76818.1 kinase [Bacillus pseudomycoides]PEO11070.1 kinase [Bacillus pseudomycoides]